LKNVDCIFPSLDTKFLITTGLDYGGHQRNSDILDLTLKEESNCKKWADYPIDIIRATGGLVGNTVLICGGYDGQNGTAVACKVY
jgi:hypothetical protein